MDDANVGAAAATVTAVVGASQDMAQGVAEQTKSMLHLDELKSYLTWGNLMKVITSVVAIDPAIVKTKKVKINVILEGKNIGQTI